LDCQEGLNKQNETRKTTFDPMNGCNDKLDRYKNHRICEALTLSDENVCFVCLFVFHSRTSNFSAIWSLSSLLMTGLQIQTDA
jgi:hypothetical protein